MKKINVLIKTTGLLYLLFLMLFAPGCASSQDNINGSQGAYNVEELNSYGEWVNINTYGRVWQPYAVNEWMPFDNGHWAYADANWTWISYEPFGWIVYHYGYWFDDPINGWVWIPSDDVWSPARVMWVDYDDYVGWAPMPPPGVVYGNPWEVNENHHWHVVKHKDFTEDNIRNFKVINPIRNEDGVREVINKPPVRNVIEKVIGKPVTEFKIQQETVKLSERQIQKMNLSQHENKRVEQNSPRVRKEVLVPKEEFHRQQSERKQNEGRKK